MASEQRPSIGFIGLGIMGRPMARNLLRAGYRVVVADIVAELGRHARRRGGRARDDAARCGRADRHPHHDAPGLARGGGRLRWRRRRARGSPAGLARHRHELHLAPRRARDGRTGGCGRSRDARRPGERGRQGGDRGHPLDHGRRDGGRLRERPPRPAGAGQDHRPRGAVGRRPGREGLQPGRRGGRHRSRLRGARAGRQGGRRPRPDRRGPPGRPGVHEGPGDAARTTSWAAASTRASASGSISRT